LRKGGGGGHHLSSDRFAVRKLAPLFVLVIVAACAGNGGPNVDAELEKRGFEVVSCAEAGELIFSCQLESGRRVQALVHEGKVFVVKAV
jgi:hypothetical protein